MEWKCNPPIEDDLIHLNEKLAENAIQGTSFYTSVTHVFGEIIANVLKVPDMILTGYPVTKESAPRIYKCYKNALTRLACREEYPLFIDFDYNLIGKIYGNDENGYYIVIGSECAEVLNDDELTAFLGGEIGRILAGHPQHFALLDNLNVFFDRIPFGSEIARNKVLGYFAQWIEACGYTVDRAALFACENLDAVFSLRKKQMGFANAKNEDILTQKQTQNHGISNLFYIKMALDLPIIGGVKRLQELYQWTHSKSFAKKYASLLYKLCINSKEFSIPCNEVMLHRHKKAMGGDTDEMEKLGEDYIFGKSGLPQSPVTGESFLRQAAFMGNATAMCLEGGCFELGIIDNVKRKKEASVLYRAAASRGNKIAMSKIQQERIATFPPQVITAAKKAMHSVPLEYWISVSGQKPDKQLLINAQCAFWIPINESIIAADLTSSASGLFGVVLTSGGIYGSIIPGDIPFFIDWESYLSSELTQMDYCGKPHLYSNKMPFYLCKPKLKGTMAELFILIKSKRIY